MRRPDRATSGEPDVIFLAPGAWDPRNGIPRRRGFYIAGHRTLIAGPYRTADDAEAALPRLRMTEGM